MTQTQTIEISEGDTFILPSGETITLTKTSTHTEGTETKGVATIVLTFEEPTE